MDREFLSDLREVCTRTKLIEILEEGIDTLTTELKPVITKLKDIDSEFTADMLEEYLLLLNDLFAFGMNYLATKANSPITPTQALLIGALNQSVLNIKHQNLQASLPKKPFLVESSI